MVVMVVCWGNGSWLRVWEWLLRGRARRVGRHLEDDESLPARYRCRDGYCLFSIQLLKLRRGGENEAVVNRGIVQLPTRSNLQLLVNARGRAYIVTVAQGASRLSWRRLNAGGGRWLSWRKKERDRTNDASAGSQEKGRRF